MVNTINTYNKNIDLSVIIVNYNLAKEIENCLNSLLKVIDIPEKINYEIIVVDNNSPDKTIYEIEKIFKSDNIKFFFLNDNVGFGKGCNYGFSQAEGKYICFLNPDTIINENIFFPIIELFKANKTFGIIGPKQQTRPPFFDFSAGFYPNIIVELFNLLGLGVFLDGFITYLCTKLNKNENIEVGWVLGAAIFIRSEIFKEISGFDKDYFMFFEEVDLCKRVSNLGFKIIYCPNLKIHHIGSVSGKKDYRLYAIRTYSSKYIYISKHYKYLTKIIMKILLHLQLFSQIVIWTVLLPVNKRKSLQKIDAFVYLLKHRLKYEHRN